MGFLNKTLSHWDKSLARQGEHLLAGRLRPGEAVLCRDLLVPNGRTFLPPYVVGTRSRLNVILTTERLFFLIGPRVVNEVPLPAIAYVAGRGSDFGGEILELMLYGGDRWCFSFPMGDSGLVDTIKRRLLCYETVDLEIDTDSWGKLLATYFPWRPNTVSWWRLDSELPPTIDDADRLAMVVQGFMEQLGGGQLDEPDTIPGRNSVTSGA